jgi:multiple sugar transport system substrate-binding protein
MPGNKNLHYVVMLTLLAVVLTGTTLVGAQDVVTIRYALWDTNQVPPYQQCADSFTAANPNIEIKIEQLGWNDYWTMLSTGFISGEVPDVFTNNISKLPEHISLGQAMDIQPLVERDSVPLDIYYPGLAELWTNGSARYGLPKDWDTVSVIYNQPMIEAAGITEEELNSMTWNPEDGGAFEQIIARLTLDANGNNGLSPDFDKDNVVQYGFSDNGLGESSGQTEWSWLAASNGFVFNDGPWDTKYYYDDPQLAEAIQWIADLWLVKGYAPRLEAQTTLGRLGLFQAQQAAMVVDGSWMIGSYVANEFPVGFARLPEGPVGRKSMFNGLADTIWAGTPHVEEAWDWAKFLASEECLSFVGQSGVVFPSIPATTDLSLQVREDQGVDVSSFVLQANEEGGTFFYPITDYAGEINSIMIEALDNIGLGNVDAATALQDANDEVNSLFE